MQGYEKIQPGVLTMAKFLVDLVECLIHLHTSADIISRRETFLACKTLISLAPAER